MSCRYRRPPHCTWCKPAEPRAPAFRNVLDSERIASVAKKLHPATRITLLRGDLAANLVGYFALLDSAGTSRSSASYALRRQRLCCDRTRFSSRLAPDCRGLQQSRANAAYYVGIADTSDSSSARFSHECLIASVETPPYGASYAAPIC